MKRALITGITGQDGSYLADYLLKNDYEVHGVVRRTSSLERSRLAHLFKNPDIYNKRLFLHYADLEDITALRRIFLSVQADELYHLAGQSHVGLSFPMAEMTCDLTAIGTLRLLEIMRDMPGKPRLFHPSSSELFGQPKSSPQNEDTPYLPTSPYGCAKAFATQIVKVYRDCYGLFACNGIMYNHESPRRGENFVSRKICRAAAAIKLGLQAKLVLGNLDAERDWGYAPDYVRGMWLSLQQQKADDYLFATGETHSVRELVELAFKAVDLEWESHVEVDTALFRPSEPLRLVGDASKAKRELGWTPSCSFQELINLITRAEFDELQQLGSEGDNSRRNRT
ncbi:MAG: GDP-mannose 4,6-dehydratase [Methylacidiphilales bacterium]|nr:GDP-mannose 4,6-dehydratase [Candidatus Methylacidiphilales bacterium]